MKKVAAGLLVLAAAWGFSACSSEKAVIEQELKQMTLQEKVGSMFFVRPEVLDTDIYYDSPSVLKSFDVHEVTDKMKETARVYPMGGVILFSHNIKDPQQLSQFIKDLKALPSQPLLCIDEEGGSVARLANNPNFHLPKFANMGTLAASGRTKEVTEAATTIGEYLKNYGFDIDFAPVADVNTNPRNVVIGARAFSNEPKVAAEMVSLFERPPEKRRHRLSEAFPRSRRHPGRFPLRLCHEPENLGRNPRLRDDSLQGRHGSRSPDDYDGPYFPAQRDGVQCAFHPVSHDSAGETAR